MKTQISIITLLFTLSAYCQNFPSFDDKHAHCALTSTFKDTSCSQVYDKMTKLIGLFNPEPISQGIYKIVDSKQDGYIWTTRTTPKAHYVDDIIFNFTQGTDATSCIVSSKSRSQTLSLFDYDTNYCNMWTVLHGLGGLAGVIVDQQNCMWIPDDAKYSCSIY
eukprot:403357604